MENDDLWYLLKQADSEIFGPVTLETLCKWAQEAQIAPIDQISKDQRQWFKAPMLAELEMDWLIEISDDQYYGPTTLGAVREFLIAGEIDLETALTNCKNNQEFTVEDFVEIIGIPEAEKEDDDLLEFEHMDSDFSMQDRIVLLEQALREERNILSQMTSNYEKLRQLYREATGSEPPDLNC